MYNIIANKIFKRIQTNKIFGILSNILGYEYPHMRESKTVKDTVSFPYVFYSEISFDVTL